MSRGREVFVIERRLGNGVRKKIALDVRTENEALTQLALFESAPAEFRTRKQRAADTVGSASGTCLDDVVLKLFLADADARVTKGELSRQYVDTLDSYLTAWARVLGGRELRKVSLSELHTQLRQWKNQHKRIVAIKAFTGWAREQGKLDRKDDPTLDLKVPQSNAKPIAERAYTADLIAAFYAALRNYTFSGGHTDGQGAWKDLKTVDLQPLRDVFVLRAKTGMHGTEIGRLASGKGAIRVLKGEGEIAATLLFPHKRGGEHVVSIDAQTLAAALRLRQLGKAPSEMSTSRNVRRVAELDPRFAGFELENLRHSFVTLGVGGRVVLPKGGGVPIEMLSQIAGHTSTTTTKRHYLGAHIPPMVALPLKLKNRDDPKRS